MANTASIKEFVSGTVRGFLQKINFVGPLPRQKYPPTVEKAVRRTINSWNLALSKDVCEAHLTVGLDIGTVTYGHTTDSIQIAIALFTFCATLFDDARGMDMQAMREFIPRFCAGQEQLHPILTHLIESTKMLADQLPQYTANKVYISLLAGCNEELCCREGTNRLTLSSYAGTFIDYSRSKSGTPEPYVAAIWPRSAFPDVSEYIQAFPDTLIFINFVNDLISLYKEILDEDQDSYVSRYMKVHDKTLERSVDDLMEKIISAMEKVRKILGDGRAREAWETFATGFVQFSLSCPRYRMKEVVPEYFEL